MDFADGQWVRGKIIEPNLIFILQNGCAENFLSKKITKIT